MSIRVVEAVYASTLELDSTATSVLARLACFAGEDGDGVFPSVARVARECRLSPRAVQYAIRRMETMGVLVKVADENPGTKRGREYRINLETLKGVGEGCTTCRGAPDAGVHDVRPMGAPDAGVGVHQMHPESSLESSGNRHDLFDGFKTGEGGAIQVAAPKSPQPADNIEAEFPQWYAAYPRKVDPKKALSAYRKARKEGASAAELLEGARRYADQVRVEGRDRKFIKHPSTWLNAGSWANEPEAGATIIPLPRASSPTMAAAADLFNDTPEAHREREKFRL